jgi:hypothetical protein
VSFPIREVNGFLLRWYGSMEISRSGYRPQCYEYANGFIDLASVAIAQLSGACCAARCCAGNAEVCRGDEHRGDVADARRHHVRTNENNRSIPTYSPLAVRLHADPRGEPARFDGLPPCRPVRTHALWHTNGIVCTARYVVDAGFCKLKCYNPKIGMDSLLVTPISQVHFTRLEAGPAAYTVVAAEGDQHRSAACWVVYARLCLEVLAGHAHCHWRNAIRSDRIRSYPIRSDFA